MGKHGHDSARTTVSARAQELSRRYPRARPTHLLRLGDVRLVRRLVLALVLACKFIFSGSAAARGCFTAACAAAAGPTTGASFGSKLSSSQSSQSSALCTACVGSCAGSAALVDGQA